MKNAKAGCGFLEQPLLQREILKYGRDKIWLRIKNGKKLLQFSVILCQFPQDSPHEPLAQESRLPPASGCFPPFSSSCNSRYILFLLLELSSSAFKLVSSTYTLTQSSIIFHVVFLMFYFFIHFWSLPLWYFVVFDFVFVFVFVCHLSFISSTVIFFALASSSTRSLSEQNLTVIQ